jgi:hypothetical protein
MVQQQHVNSSVGHQTHPAACMRMKTLREAAALCEAAAVQLPGGFLLHIIQLVAPSAVPQQQLCLLAQFQL